MTDNRPDNLLGYPITGDYSRYSELRAEQWPVEQLLPLLQVMISDSNVASFGWGQYTPSFNDGDPCIFSAYGTWVRETGDSDVVTEEDEDYSEWEDDNYEYSVRHHPYDDKEVSPVHYRDLDSAIEGGHFDEVLLELFGDPANVTWRRDSGEFHIEYASHD